MSEKAAISPQCDKPERGLNIRARQTLRQLRTFLDSRPVVAASCRHPWPNGQTLVQGISIMPLPLVRISLNLLKAASDFAGYTAVIIPWSVISVVWA